MALQVGKRLRIILSDNNAGIDDALLGGVIAERSRIISWPNSGLPMAGTSSAMDDGGDYAKIVAALNGNGKLATPPTAGR